jgi:ABC-2 type transport system ATP-binding protein
MDILCAERVSKGFGGIFRLGPLDLHVKPGEILGIVGSEGTGKTTLLKLFWGFIRPDNGRISVLGLQPHLHQLQLRRKAGYLGHPPQYQFECSAKQFIQRVGHFYDCWNEVNAMRLLTSLEVDPNAKMRDLSIGDRRKVALASVSSHQPALLLLDEPTFGIDRFDRLAILRFLRRLAKEQQVSILLSCAIPDDLHDIANRILMLKDGRPVEYASALQES